MATLTGYVSAVAEAARQMAGMGGGAVVAAPAVVAEQDGRAVAGAVAATKKAEVEVKAMPAVRDDKIQAEAPKDRARASEEVAQPVPHSEAAVQSAESGPRMGRSEGSAPRTSGPNIRPQTSPPPIQPLQRPVRSQAGDVAPLRTTKAQDEGLIGAAARKSSAAASVDVTVHAADDLTAAIADSEEVRDTILRTVAEVLRDR